MGLKFAFRMKARIRRQGLFFLRRASIPVATLLLTAFAPDAEALQSREHWDIYTTEKIITVRFIDRTIGYKGHGVFLGKLKKLSPSEERISNIRFFTSDSLWNDGKILELTESAAIGVCRELGYLRGYVTQVRSSNKIQGVSTMYDAIWRRVDIHKSSRAETELRAQDVICSMTAG